MTTTPLTDAINALTRYANETTGAGDTNLSDAVATLVAGYGGGSSSPVLLLKWDFTQSLTDEIKGKTASLANATRDANGVHFTGANNTMTFGSMPINGTTYELDIANMDYNHAGSHGRFFLYDNTNGKGLIYRSTGKWAVYTGTWQESSFTDKNYFSGHTLKVVFDDYLYPSFYRDNTFMFKGNAPWSGLNSIGSYSISYYNADITGLRVYKGDTTV